MVKGWVVGALAAVAVVVGVGGYYVLAKTRKVVVSPVNVPQGGMIQWTATNFPPHTQVTAGTGVSQQNAVTDATGKASGSLSTYGQVPFQGYQLIVNVTANPSEFAVADYNVV